MPKPIRINFVCHGNICRSPMAEWVMKDLVAQAEAAGRVLAGRIIVGSCATSAEELGEDIYPPAKRVMRAHGVPFGPHAATRLRSTDYDRWDLFVCMDGNNLRNIGRTFGGKDPAGKVHKLAEYARVDGARPLETTFGPEAPDIADPWYTGDFETTFAEILAGCRGLLDTLLEE